MGEVVSWPDNLCVVAPQRLNEVPLINPIRDLADLASKNDQPGSKLIPTANTFTYTFPKYSITAIKLTPG